MQSQTLSIKTAPKEIWIGWISSLVEAYNMAIFSFLAPVLAPYLFFNEQGNEAIIFSYLIAFLSSCVFYPLGAVYFGSIGDKEGRQKICVYSTLGLAASTALMGTVPLGTSYAWIGFFILISSQNFFSGGEYYGSIVYSLEHGSEKQNGLLSGLSCLFAVFGLMLASSLAAINAQVQSIWWLKAAFLLGGVTGIISFILKNYCQETPIFQRLKKQKLEDLSLIAFIKLRKWILLKTVSIIAFFAVSYAFIFIFLPLLDPFSAERFSTTQTLMLYGICLLMAGYLADYVGIEKLISIGLLLFIVLILPLSYLISNVLIIQCILTFSICLTIGPLHGYLMQQFSPEERCRGVFVSSAIATSIFGGSCLPICLYLNNYNSLVLCSFYPLLMAIIAFISIRFIK